MKSYQAPIRISRHSTQTRKYYDPKSDPENPRWMMVDVKYRRKTKRLIGLAEIKEYADRLEGFPLIRRGNRLSIMPVSKEHWDFILSLE